MVSAIRFSFRRLLAVMTVFALLFLCMSIRTRRNRVVSRIESTGASVATTWPSLSGKHFRQLWRDIFGPRLDDILAVRYPENVTVTKEHLRTLDGLGQLTRLTLSNTTIEEGAFAELANLKFIRILEMDGTKFRLEDLQELRHTTVKVIHMRNCSVTEKDIRQAATDTKMLIIVTD